MTKPQTPDQIVPLITNVEQYPIPLFSRFGENFTPEDIETYWLGKIRTLQPGVTDLIAQQAARLSALYADDWPNRTGDPRAFQAEEITFISSLKGQIGVHAQFELKAEDTPEDPEELADLIEHWQRAMELLGSIYNHTQFFLAMGDDITYECRLTLNAFTPLSNGRIGSLQVAPPERYMMISPYHQQERAESIEECQILEEIAHTLIEMGRNDTPAIAAISAAKARTKKSDLIDCIDLMADDFKRIKALDPGDEILDLCDRALRATEQNVPVLEVRDRLQKTVSKLLRKVSDLEDQLEAARAHGEGVAIPASSECSTCNGDGGIYGPGEPRDSMLFVCPDCDGSGDASEFSAGVVPEGWKLVPVEPTGQMLKHGTLARTLGNGGSDKVYKAMLAAAPQPPKEGSGNE